MQDYVTRHQTQRMLRAAWASTALVALALCFATLSPGAPAVGPPNNDKLYHFVGFAILALPLGYVRSRWGWQIILGVTAFGAMIEVIQPFVGRSGEWADLAADLAGAIAAVLAMRLLRR